MPVASLENNKRLVVGSFIILRNTVSLNYYLPKLQSNGFIHDRRQG